MQHTSRPAPALREDRMDSTSESLQRGRRNDSPPKSAMQDYAESEDTSAGTSQRRASTSRPARNFVYKLSSMLEDKSNIRVIWWSEAGDSFFVNPNEDFNNILIKYFNHKKNQSFVRQLNMYGFHKVNDVFQGSEADTDLWNYKHAEGTFRRGHPEDLPKIKRRSSKHNLDTREVTQSSISNPVPYHPLPTHTSFTALRNDTVEDRLSRVEHYYLEQHAALKQMELLSGNMSAKFDVVIDCMMKSQQLTRTLSDLINSFMPDHQHPIHRNIATMTSEIDGQMERLRNFDAYQVPNDRRQSTASSGYYSSGSAMSPYGVQDESRRASLAYPTNLRAPPSRSAATSPRRMGSVSQFGAPSQVLPGRPSSTHPPPPVPSYWGHSTQQAIGVDSSSTPYAPRRHTSADIRDNAGWRSAQGSSEHLPLRTSNVMAQYSSFDSGNSAQWPSSPGRGSQRGSQNEHQLRDSLSRYQIDSRNPSTASDATVTPQISYPHYRTSMQQDMSQASGGLSQRPQASPFGHISENSLFNQQPNTRSLFNEKMWSNSGSSTRRSSMAHILNPADTAEQDEEEDVAPEERPKRKRMG